MKTIFEAATVDEIKDRLLSLRPENTPLWGRMTPAQTLAHCSAAFAMAEGKVASRRILLGRLLGPIAKRSLIHKGEPMRRNVPTHPSVLITDERDFAAEREKLLQEIDRFAQAGPAIYTTQPHFFFGRLTPEEWASLTYQHLDHHLRQFGV